MSRWIVAASTSLAFAGWGCAPPLRYHAREMDQLRAETAARAVGVDAEEVVIPFAYGTTEVRLAGRLTAGAITEREQVLRLANAIDDPDQLGIQYAPTPPARSKRRWRAGGATASRAPARDTRDRTERETDSGSRGRSNLDLPPGVLTVLG